MNVKFKAHLFIFSLFFCYNLSAQEIVKGDFKNENPQSSYVPSFDMDATDKPVKNVILMIGDGMGLAHICSGMYANQGQLTITNLKHTVSSERNLPTSLQQIQLLPELLTQPEKKLKTERSEWMKITKLFQTYRRSYPAMATFQESLPLTISTELLLLLSLLTNRNVECLKKYGQIFLTVS